MKIKCSEPTSQKYIYVDPKTNQVHLLMPLVGGESIGLDNTCQTVIELQKFFGKDVGADVKRASALHELERYKLALDRDIATLPEGRTKDLKIDRARQVVEYIKALKEIQNHPSLFCLSGSYPNYPDAIQRIMAQKSNIFSMRLSPLHPDPVLKTVNPIFSPSREGGGGFGFSSKDEVRSEVRNLGSTLRTEFATLVIGPKQDAKSLVQNAVLEAFRGRSINSEADFEALKAQILREIKQRYPSKETAVLTLDQTAKPPILPATKANMDNWTGFDEADKNNIEGYVTNIIGFCLADDFWNSLRLESQFNLVTAANPEQLSIMIQFFLGEVNIFCTTNKLTAADFGAALDNKPALSLALARNVKESLRTGQNVEENLFTFINTNYRDFALSRPLSKKECSDIAARFNAEYAIIKDSPHFDEFILYVPEMKGNFVNHHGTIALNFAQFYNTQYPDRAKKLFSERVKQFENINGKLDHKNASVGADFEFDEKSLPQLLQSSKNIDTIASILTAEVATGNLRVFQSLPDKIIVDLIQSKNFNALRTSVFAKLTDPALQAEFNKKFSTTQSQSLQLTTAMERSLYTQVMAERGPEALAGLSNGPDKLRRAFMLLNIKISEPGGIEPSEHEGYVINCPLESVVKIKRAYENSLRTIHLTPEMAKSLYLAVEQRFGKDSPHVTAMNTKSNTKSSVPGTPPTPEKINFALSCLDIKVSDNAFWGVNGYKLTADPGAIEAIDSIHQARLTTMPMLSATMPAAAAAAASPAPLLSAAIPVASASVSPSITKQASALPTSNAPPKVTPSAAAAAPTGWKTATVQKGTQPVATSSASAGFPGSSSVGEVGKTPIPVPTATAVAAAAAAPTTAQPLQKKSMLLTSYLASSTHPTSAAAASSSAVVLGPQNIILSVVVADSGQPRLAIKFSSQAVRDAFKEQFTKFADKSGMEKSVAQNLLSLSLLPDTLYVVPSVARGPGVFISTNGELSINLGNNAVRDYFTSRINLTPEQALAPTAERGKNALYFDINKLPPTPSLESSKSIATTINPETKETLKIKRK